VPVLCHENRGDEDMEDFLTGSNLSWLTSAVYIGCRETRLPFFYLTERFVLPAIATIAIRNTEKRILCRLIQTTTPNQGSGLPSCLTVSNLIPISGMWIGTSYMVENMWVYFPADIKLSDQVSEAMSFHQRVKSAVKRVKSQILRAFSFFSGAQASKLGVI